jgi:hypothetical protein
MFSFPPMASCTHNFHICSCSAVLFAFTLALHSGLLTNVLETNVHKMRKIYMYKSLMWVGLGSTEVKLGPELSFCADGRFFPSHVQNAPLAPPHLSATSKNARAHTSTFPIDTGLSTANKRALYWPKLLLFCAQTNIHCYSTTLGQIHAGSHTRRRLALPLQTTRQNAAPRLIL